MQHTFVCDGAAGLESWGAHREAPKFASAASDVVDWLATRFASNVNIASSPLSSCMRSKMKIKKGQYSYERTEIDSRSRDTE